MKRYLTAAVAAGAVLVGATAAKAEGELFLYNWSNYFPPELLTKFEEETGIAVTLDVYDSNETMLAKLQAGAGGYDVIVPSGYMVRILIEEGLVQEINALEMENGTKISAPHDNPPYDEERVFSAPYMWGTTGVVYDSARSGGVLEDSWREFFQPRAELQGEIAALNDEVELYNAAAYFLGFDKCTETPEEAQAILDLLEQQKPHLKMYQSDGAIDRAIAGEVVMHQIWNGAAHRVGRELPNAVYMYPQEGISFWADNFMVPVDAQNAENAKSFINWMMAPENIAAASNFTGYMNAIEGSPEFLDDALKNDPAVNMPEEYADRLRPESNCSVKARELRNRVWTRLKS